MAKKRRRKYFKGYCKGCEQRTKLVFVDESENSLTLRCDDCLSLNDYPKKRVLKSGRVLTEPEYEKRKEAMSKVADYTPQNTYWKGQKIKHQAFGEVGTIVRKESTEDNNKVIVVEFDKTGTKKLVEGLGATSN